MIMAMFVMCRQHGGDGLHALDPQHHGFADFAQGFGLRRALGRDFQHKADMVVLDHQALDHVLLHHGAPAGRVHHLVERLEHIVADNCHGRRI